MRTFAEKSRSVAGLAALAALILLIALCSQVPRANASMVVESFISKTTDSQAGAHPDLSTSFVLAEPGVTEAAENVTFDAPQGLFGNPQALLRCSASDFAFAQCSSNSQAGLVTIYANHNGNPGELLGTAPLYDLEPNPEQTALFGLVVPIIGVPIQIPVAVRTDSDYGLRFTVSGLTQTYPLKQANLTFWGFPASHLHDSERFSKAAPGEPAGCPGTSTPSCVGGVAASIPDRPLIDNPTICTGAPLTTTLTVRSYQHPEDPTVIHGTYPETTGCEKEVFKPAISANLTTDSTDSASGFDLDLRAPQFFGQSPAPSQLRSAVVTLPPELTINPDAADGQTACSEGAAGFGSSAPAACPDSSKIGTFAVTTPALTEELIGSIYIGDPKPGSQYRLFLIANGVGIHVKLLGTVRPDPETGQIAFEVLNLPQVPFDDFQIHLFASDRGLLATPTHCTIYEVSGVFTPWNDVLPRVTSNSTLGLGSGPGGEACPGQTRPFEPRLEAGTLNPAAGAFSPFHLKLDRDDGDQFLGDLTFRLPPGFSGDLRGISYCPTASIVAASQNKGRLEQSSPSCPASSQIGTTNVAAGPGSHPFHAAGKMYLAGPLNGAPLSLAAITPALAGPYDYGVVVVRIALHVDPLTAQVYAASDKVPSIIGGIPIRMRSIQVNIDKPNFTINPTNCSPMSVDSQGIGDQGTITNFSSYFNAVNCSTMPFKPKMTIRQVGSKGVRRANNPQLQFDLTTRPGDANIKSLAVTLPPAFAIDQRHLGNICSEKELTEKQCAGRTPIGKATTTTPLLDQPLTGPVYAVSGSGGLPKLAFVLDGQVDLLPRAETKTITKGGAGELQTTVPVVPDAPIGHFALTVFGGKTGYLVNTRDLCAHAPVSQIEYTGQNGKTYSQSVKVKASCGKKSKRAKRHRG